tara:strand:+ start:1192 stop:1977 length:786 start_codon:yes stop_codon:yes gene_type:complete
MILGISGKKQAGKTTIANIFHGAVLKKNGMVQDYNVNENGKLIIKTVNNQGKEGWGEFDVERKDEQFIEYAHYNMWPYVKLYNFAEPVKDMCINLFGFTYEQAYGTEEQKNQTLSGIRWENMPRFQNMKLMQKMPIDAKKSWKWRKGKMTAREFMQFFGTDIMRKIHPDVWANACINKITKEGSDLAIIADVRFPNEVEAINKAGGKVLRLERDVHEDNHDSETALDANKYNHSNFWHVLDNREMTIQETITEVKSLLEQI